MSYLLDTNVVSEWAKERPDPGVVRWLAEVDEDQVVISVATLAELRRGIERLPKGQRRSQLNRWLREDISERFEGRVVAVDQLVADQWGQIIADAENEGRPIDLIDALIGATARVHNLTLVTRNERHFTSLLASVVNPWTR